MKIPPKPNSLIVGGTRGIGLVLARLLHQNGHKVSIIGRTKPDVRGTDITFYPVDLQDSASVDQGLARICGEAGKLNYLVFLQRFKEPSPNWDNELAVSLSATRQIIEFTLKHFQPRGDKSIVLISSIAALLVAEEQSVEYHVAKAGLVQMARYFAVKAGPMGIRVNAVSPGTIIKPENEAFYKGNTRLVEMLKKLIPLARMGSALEVAEAISFFCSPKSSFITGQHILVDGGVNLLAPETLAKKLSSPST